MRHLRCANGLKALAGLVALLVAQPSGATLLPYTLSGTITGLKLTVTCDPWDWNGTSDCMVFQPFERNFGVIALLDLSPGTNVFDFGSHFGPPGEYMGTIISDDTLTGIDLSWGWSNCPTGGAEGCISIGGEAPTFKVEAGAVPEPSTWAMMLVGLGAAAFVCRRTLSRSQRCAGTRTVA